MLHRALLASRTARGNFRGPGLNESEDRKGRKTAGRSIDAKLRQLLTEIESCPVPPRIQELAKELQAALDQRTDKK